MNYLDYTRQIPMGRKGWYASEMQTWSKEKMQNVLKLYGKNGLTENTYKYLINRVGSTSNSPVSPTYYADKVINTLKSPDAGLMFNATNLGVKGAYTMKSDKLLNQAIEKQEKVNAKNQAAYDAKRKQLAAYEDYWARKNYKAITGQDWRAGIDLSNYTLKAIAQRQKELGVVADGKWGAKTQQAYETLLKTKLDEQLTPKLNDDTSSVNNGRTFGLNWIKNPLLATIDGALYVADIAGAPSHVTNYLRDLNVSLPYRAKAGISALGRTLFNDKSLRENYNEILANPGTFVRFGQIQPLTNTERNYSGDELEILKQLAGTDFKIDSSDIRKTSGNYGGRGKIADMINNPHKIVQLSLGRTSGDPKTRIITDTFDVNIASDQALKDNAMYQQLALESGEVGTYEGLRASMPKWNMVDIMPKLYKINSQILL